MDLLQATFSAFGKHLRWVLVAFLVWLGIGLAQATTQTKLPLTTADCTSVAGIGTKSWSNPSRAMSNNTSYATASVDGTTSVFLKCLNYGFTIPATATINGITVTVERKSNRTTNGGAKDAAMRLVKAGSIGTTDRATATIYTTAANVTEAHGGAADLWGTTWTAADINAANFGAAFAATKPSSAGSSHTVAVDFIQITVDYTDTTPANVTSVNLANTSPTAASSVAWTVVFSESVTGVDATDFALIQGGGVSGASITSVTGSGTTWTVNVNTGSGSGTLGLNLVDNDSILDADLNKLGGPGTTGANNGSFTGQVYTVDKASPRVNSINLAAASPTKAASVSWSVVFSEAVTGVDTTDFALATSGISGASITSVTGAGTTFTVTANTGSGTGTLGLNLVDNDSIIDASLIPLGGSGTSGAANGSFTGQVYNLDRTNPIATSISSCVASGSDVAWTVNFSENVTGVDFSDFSLAASGLSGAFVASVTGSGQTWTVVANTGIGSGSLVLSLVDNDSIVDQVLTPLGGAGAGNGNVTAASCAISSTLPIAGYAMDEASWNGTADEVADSSGASPGTAQNSANTAAGDTGTCRYGVFDNGGTITKGAIVIPNLPDMTDDFTITAWVRTTDNTKAGQRILIDDENQPGELGYGLTIGDAGTGTVRFYSRGSSVVNLDTGNVIANNTWYFVAGVADIANGVRKIYVYSAAGALLSSVSVNSTGWGTDSGDASIGGETSASTKSVTTNHFRGNLDEVRVYDKALSQAALLALAQQTHSCASVNAVDHYELSLPTASLACVASTVTVTACVNSSSPCTNKATTVNGMTALLSTTGAALGATTITFDATGVATTTLSYPTAPDGTAAAVTLSGEQVLAANARQCCPNGSSCSAANSCSTTFNTAGFVVGAAAGGGTPVIATQTAGTTSSGYFLRAVKTNSATKACEASLTGSTTVNFGYQCVNPSTCSAGNRMVVTGNSGPTTIAANPNAVTSNTLPVSLTFNASGIAPFTFNYSDVGQLTLYATKAASGSLLTSLSGTSNTFVTKPAGFSLSNIKCSSYASATCATGSIASPGNNPGASTATDAAFIQAGRAFSATVTAVDSTGSATPNYGRENAAEGVTLTATLVQPSGGTAPALTNPSAFGSFTSGVATGTTFSWPEVGIITLTPRVADGDYLGVGQVTGTTTGNVGRFIPDHFAVTAGSASAGCGPTFTYFGQDGFSTPFTLTAQNASNATTTNYTGSFARLGLGTWSNYVFTATGLPGGTSLSASTTAPVGAWGSGIATITAKHQVSRPASPVVETGVTISALPVDPDGVTLAAATAVQTAATPLRYGRVRLQNAYGSELLPLQIPLALQYWNGSWQNNTADSCTAISASQFAWAFPSGTAARPNNLLACESAMTVSGTAPNYTLNLSAPGSGNAGWADLTLNLGLTASGNTCTAVGGASPAATTASAPWLQFNWTGTTANPSARATFGVFRSPLIYRRENY